LEGAGVIPVGSSVKAICQCGLDEDILIGGGMANFTTTCFFPCLCETCYDVVQVNLLQKAKRCPKCGGRRVVPYDDPSLSQKSAESKREEKWIASWNAEEPGKTHVITDGAYKCPRCGNMALRFSEGKMFWD
jgi:Zn finger protein HypA/HybF involved in hydrogenase expression